MPETFSPKIFRITVLVDYTDAGYSLSIGLQLADLKEHHEIIFAVAGAGLWAGHGCQLGGRYCVGRRQ